MSLTDFQTPKYCRKRDICEQHLFVTLALKINDVVVCIAAQRFEAKRKKKSHIDPNIIMGMYAFVSSAPILSTSDSQGILF